jgi:hypothetical protein
MSPNKAQRVWRNLSQKWISMPYNPPRKRRRGPKVKKGILTNFVQVVLVNAITGETAKGYIQANSIRALTRWLGYHNHRAEVEQVALKPNSTFDELTPGELKNLPILIKLGKYQFPYIIDSVYSSYTPKHKILFTFRLQTVDNLKYLEMVAARKEEVMSLFNKIKSKRKKQQKANKSNKKHAKKS